MDKITQRLFAVGAIIFALGFLIQSTSPAIAAAPEKTYEAVGRYQMEFCSIQSDTKDNTYWYILVYDTTNGDSKLYYGAGDMGKIVPAGSDYNLPTSPLYD